MSEEKESADRIVATRRMPVSVKALAAITDALTKEHGPGLTTRQHGVEMECEQFGHPHFTTCGEAMYDNTHFRTEAEAWDKIRRSCEATMHILARNIEECEARLIELREQAANEVKRFAGIPEKPDKKIIHFLGYDWGCNYCALCPTAKSNGHCERGESMGYKLCEIKKSEGY